MTLVKVKIHGKADMYWHILVNAQLECYVNKIDVCDNINMALLLLLKRQIYDNADFDNNYTINGKNVHIMFSKPEPNYKKLYLHIDMIGRNSKRLYIV